MIRFFCPNYGNCRTFERMGKILFLAVEGVLKEAFDLDSCRIRFQILQNMTRIHAVPNYGTHKTDSSAIRNNNKKSLNNGENARFEDGKSGSCGRIPTEKTHFQR